MKERWKTLKKKPGRNRSGTNYLWGPSWFLKTEFKKKGKEKKGGTKQISTASNSNHGCRKKKKEKIQKESPGSALLCFLKRLRCGMSDKNRKGTI